MNEKEREQGRERGKWSLPEIDGRIDIATWAEPPFTDKYTHSYTLLHTHTLTHSLVYSIYVFE